ncbi:amino acid--[acyl-carrier-protein] ligase [Curtobacterium sp. VKM Ac-2922]|uniref:amino acid--[acyl-carrier-protein] ligase n=1 Tax=Curtobacterium sp. VKM Ac-2922 TaxID=2929475 RepID=UPI001FB28EF5|nr:amino acid--[acyl-carrier-protein] ligase [Curtobacterium sp. VKM Ac-2922]MCJ1712567.1 amino acid--[acyl-carrier-protein] ligase [Curtobacterium sp. VKM Ac-2922]
MTITEPTTRTGSTSTPLDAARADLRGRLLADRVLFDLGSPGLYGRSAVFERVYAGIDAAGVRAMADLDLEVVRFPPVEPLAAFERTDYIASFPDLAASISGFTGDDRKHRALLAARERGDRWEDFLDPADLMLTPAVCHPLYGTLTGTIPQQGRTFDVLGDSFRREPSLDPMRLQAFHMHEFVHVGTPASARAHRDDRIPVIRDLLTSFGLEIDVVAANDPFFGRVGTMLARNQVEQSLKYEFVTPVYGEAGEPTAIGSANLHEDHFGTSFDIRTADAQVAHSACVAWGLERVTIALFAAHGTDPASWPADARRALDL